MPPPELHADRVVAEMIHWIIAERDRRWEIFWAEWNSGSIGNPLGQSRMVKRMREGGGDLLLHLHLDPGKRARFELSRWLRSAAQCRHSCQRSAPAAQAVAFGGGYPRQVARPEPAP